MNSHEVQRLFYEADDENLQSTLERLQSTGYDCGYERTLDPPGLLLVVACPDRSLYVASIQEDPADPENMLWHTGSFHNIQDLLFWITSPEPDTEAERNLRAAIPGYIVQHLVHLSQAIVVPGTCGHA